MVDGRRAVFTICGGDDVMGPAILSRNGSTVFVQMDAVAVPESL